MNPGMIHYSVTDFGEVPMRVLRSTAPRTKALHRFRNVMDRMADVDRAVLEGMHKTKLETKYFYDELLHLEERTAARHKKEIADLSREFFEEACTFLKTVFPEMIVRMSFVWLNQSG